MPTPPSADTRTRRATQTAGHAATFNHGWWRTISATNNQKLDNANPIVKGRFDDVDAATSRAVPNIDVAERHC